MTHLFTSKDNALKALGRTLLCALCVFVTGALNAPPVSAANLPQVPEINAAGADQPVPIDQQPLTIAAPIPPNIVLMLDDSGSMMWDVMPDWGNLDNHDDLAIINSGVNGVYYNPSETYLPPPKANGTSSWPNADFDKALVNGFYTGDLRHWVDLTTYDGDYDSSTSTTRDNGYPYGSSQLQYSVSIQKMPDLGAYDAPENCPPGTHESSHEHSYCYYSNDPSPKFYEFKEWINGSGTTWYVSKCNAKGVVYNKDTKKCIDESKIVIANDNHSWSCPDSTTSIGETTVDYDDDREICIAQTTYGFFTYSTSDVWGYLDGSYPAPASCPSGTDDSGSQDQYCYYDNYPGSKFYEFYDSVSGGTYYVSKCNNEGYRYNKSTHRCLAAGSFSTTGGQCPSGTVEIGTTTVGYNDNENICASDDKSDYSAADPGTSGMVATYTRHYVGKSGTCAEAGLSSDVCVDPSQADPSDPSVQSGMSGAEVLQNVANWFSYYHTRMLMAKSSLMNAFSGLNKDYRLGFGSLHNNGGFPDEVTTVSYSDHKIAEVRPFGDGSSASDQKSKFWDWILDKYPYQGTPLRKSLKTIGDYYKTSQPWQTSASDPTELACRQSYAILTTDGFWNGDSPGLGNVDKTDGDDVKVPGSEDTYETYSVTPPYSDDNSNTLADVAMYYWDHDLRPHLDNEVPVSGKVDPAFWQHMTTFTIGLGYKPVGIEPAGATKEQIFDWARNGGTPSDFSWPKPENDSIYNIADMLHAAVNGHGGFYSATSPQAFTEGLQDALKRIASRKGSGASLSANSATLGTDTYIYKVLYHTGDWSGSLYAYKVDENGDYVTASGDPADPNDPNDAIWSAEAQMPAPGERNIHTYNPDSGEDVLFKLDVSGNLPSLSGDEKAALGGTTDRQQKMVQYLRGKLIEGNDWRGRLTLGDIVDSQPIYVGAPDSKLYSDSTMDFLGSNGYKAWADGKVDVTPILYMAANDGMLHGFNADTGEETYAYLPAAVIMHGSETGDHGISQIADPDYGYQNGGVPHQYFNDGQLTVADVYMGGSWKAVLVGTTGRGNAKAVYALDVTDPDDVKLLWEKSAYTPDCDDCDYIGQMTSKPIIAQVSDGQWAVLMGNGYNSEKNQAALLQFKLSDGTLHVHTTNTDTDNGLAGPGIWIADSTDNISTVAYAGDLYGHVWSFTLNNGASTPTSTGKILFTAEDDDGNPQPITAGMAIQQDAATGKRWVFFGTGKYLADSDVDDVSSQTWYGLIVSDKDGNEIAAGSRDNLVSREIFGGGGQPRASSTMAEATPIGDKDGWYINLPDAGERMVVANQFNGHLLYGTSIIPSTTNLCKPSGSGWLMAVSPFTGTNPGWDVFGDTVVTTNPGTGEETTRNAGGVYFGSMPNRAIFMSGADNLHKYYVSTSSGDTKSGNLGPNKGAGKKAARISWREVISD